MIDKHSYIKGQEDLILEIKKRVSTLLEETEGSDIMFDTILLLKGIEPIEYKEKK